MTHLLQIALGPVQGFIAASRKTRDLAAGSALLVELSGVAAKELQTHGASPIFPGGWDEAAANVLLVKCREPRAAAERAYAAVLGRLTARIAEAAKTAGPLIDDAMRRAWDAQARGLLEWFAVWTPLTDDYARDRRRVGALMAARKSVRAFGPAPAEPRGNGVEGRPKSPLDPAFAGVLRIDQGWGVRRGTDVRVKGREHLDAVGLVKRFGRFQDVEGFPSTRTIAVSDLVATAHDQAAVTELKSLVARADDTLRAEVFDLGDALYGDLDDAPEAFRNDLARLARRVRQDVPLRGYYAFLHGDGDSMGVLLDNLAEKGNDAHRDFSVRLGAFAKAVRPVVESHQGRLVYAGGDDVVALLPMATAVHAAIDLRKLFQEEVEAWARENVQLETYPSLTVGVAFVHIQENLLDAYRFAKSLEAKGKRLDGKDRLVVGVRPRGGADLSTDLRFSQDEPMRWDQAKDDLKSGRLSRGYPYEIAALHRELSGAVASKSIETDAAVELARVETIRIRDRKRGSGGERTTHVPPPLRSLDDLARYASLLLTAHFATREGEDK